MTGELDKRLQELIYEAAIVMECEVIALETDQDHVHLFVNCLPKYSPAQIIQRVKGHTSMLSGRSSLGSSKSYLACGLEVTLWELPG